MSTSSKLELDFMEKVVRSATDRISPINTINRAQHEALKRLERLSFPSRHDEDWKYYDFADILNTDFNINANNTEAGLSKPELTKLIDQYVFRETADNLIITINGNFSSELSNFKSKQGVNILNFNNPQDLESHPHSKIILEKFFAQNIDREKNYFRLINTSLISNGFLLAIDENYHSDQTLQILHISDRNNFNQIRSLIYAGKNSKLDIIVTYVGLQDSKYFTNAVIETYLDQGAELKLEKIQNESKQATKLYNFYAQVERDCKFEFESFSFGALSARSDITIDILGSNSEVSVNGLYVVNGNRKSHHKVEINHHAAHSSSTQLFKGLLDDHSKAEFNGLINVCKGAEKTDAKQLNSNLLMSPTAHIDSRPQLNILNDDVKCSHGSTVGRLNEDEIFYLESRGIPYNGAKTILTYSFCQELINHISLKSARNYASNLAFANLAKASEGSEIFSTLAENTKFKRYRVENAN